MLVKLRVALRNIQSDILEYFTGRRQISGWMWWCVATWFWLLPCCKGAGVPASCGSTFRGGERSHHELPRPEHAVSSFFFYLLLWLFSFGPAFLGSLPFFFRTCFKMMHERKCEGSNLEVEESNVIISIIYLPDVIEIWTAFLFLWSKFEFCGIHLGSDFMTSDKCEFLNSTSKELLL